MTIERQEEIRQQLVGYYRSYQNDGEPIAVNFRSLVPELSKLERYTHLIHSYPAKLLANIPFYFFATDELCPQEETVLDPFCGTGTVLLEAALSGRTALGADANPLAELITNVKTHHTSYETLTNPVYLAGYIEQVGTGTNDVIDRCVELGLRKPEFRQDEDFMVTLWRKEGSGTVQSDPESLPNSKESARSRQGVRRGLSCT